MISVGNFVKFKPYENNTGFLKKYNYFSFNQEQIGKVIFVNYKHQWFLVEYCDGKLKTSFKFVDIGNSVKEINDD